MTRFMEYLGAIGAALSAKRTFTHSPYSEDSFLISRMLYERGYLAGFSIVGQNPTLCIKLKYDMHGRPLVRTLQPISKPSKKVCVTVTELRKLLEKEVPVDFIIRTSIGFVWAREAVQRRLGGELTLRVSV